jgi:hypothetical protein
MSPAPKAAPPASPGTIEAAIRRELEDLSPAAARDALVTRLATLTGDVSRLSIMQDTLLAALRARDVMAQRGAALAGGRFIELGARDFLGGDNGFHDAMWDQDIAYRWTGPEHSVSLRVWLDRTVPLVLEIALFDWGNARNRGALTLTVDGTPVGLAEAGEKLLRSAPFPQLAASLYSDVVLHVPYLSGGKKDAPRGIAITHLRFLTEA